MLRFARHSIAIGILVAAEFGCSAKDGQLASQRATPQKEWAFTRPPPTTSNVVERPLAVKAEPTLVRQGRTPLVYMVETGDPIVIVVSDLTTNTRLASVPVGGRTIVRVESANGIFVGSQNQTSGPLDSSHNYGIFIEANTTSMMRNESVGPTGETSR